MPADADTAARREGDFPGAPERDSALALLGEGYEFGRNRFQSLGTDAFRCRFGLAPVLYTHGADAARMFYHPDRFTRRGALPPTAVALLQGRGSVQQLDGGTHERRKALFLELLDPAAATRLVDLFNREWARALADWPRRGRITLHIEVERVLTRAAARWAGVPLGDDRGADLRAREIGAMIDGAGAYGPRWLRGWWRRGGTEHWLRSHVRQLRSGPPLPESGDAASPAARVASYREEGRLLPVQVAATELLNLLRPTVAVGRWVTFAALALHRHPHYLPRLRAREPGMLQSFAQEVRRFHPFFPAIAGRVREPFEWRGHRFAQGDRVMLDLYATNHDPRLWEHPDRFEADRFLARTPSPYDLVPQGAGEYPRTHRCPGENPSIALLMSAIDQLATRMEYQVPEQDLHYRLDRFPAIPKSRFVIEDVRPGSR